MHRPSRSTGRSLWVVGAALLLMAQAQVRDSTPGESERALAGLIRVGIPTPAASSIAATAGIAYGWLDPVADLAVSGHRLGARLSAAFTALPFLSLAADVRGHLDAFPNSAGGPETNFYGEPRLTARFARSAVEGVYWGAEADVRFVGAQAPSVHWPATSPSMRGLLGTRVQERTWLAAQLGFQLDRSAQVVPDPGSVSATDRRTLGMSSWSAVQWGLGASHRLARFQTELIGEVSGEAFVGQRAPSFVQSPWQLSAGARQPLSEALSLLVSAEVGLSARPQTWPVDDLRPIQPRAAGGLTIVWRLHTPEPALRGQRAEEPLPTPPSVTPAPSADPPAAALATTPVSGMVVDEGGRPLPDALVTLMRAGAEPQEVRSLEDGSFAFTDVPVGSVELRVSTAGFDEVQIAIQPGQERIREVVLHPSVPAGQVRGRVLDLSGSPVQANITITPGEHPVEVGSDGSFTVELTPGRYTVKLRHPSFTTQERVIVVHDRGVVILNIALAR